MTVRRIMGLETEFGVIADSGNPIAWSTEVVDTYARYGRAGSGATPVRWDYAAEDPLLDARGFRRERAAAHPSQLTDDPNQLAPSGTETELLSAAAAAELSRPQAANTVLRNGARLYVDHAHPEYSGPEVTNPREAVLWDRAGDQIARETLALLNAGDSNYALYKNNVDGKGASYGTHENYLVRREVPFDEIIRYLTPFFVTRPIICGAGRVGIGQKSEVPGFQISQRADYVENDVGLETTFNRPIINTRDEPHADGTKYRRLHVIGGDANLFDISNLLKVGTTSLVLWLLENGPVPLELDAMALYSPVRATWEVSHDIELTRKLDMHDEAQRTAIEIQQVYLDVVSTALAERSEVDADTAEVLRLWQEVLDALRTDPASAANRVEWIAKYQLLESLRARDQLPWDSDALRAFDLQWHDLRPGKSIVERLDAAGRIERIFSPAEVDWAVLNAPRGTRAYLRGGLINKFPAAVRAAGWESITVAAERYHGLVRIPLLDPAGANQDAAAAALAATDIDEFIAQWQPETSQKLANTSES
ncbi:MAG: depupylase/deamidase Dop [Trueperella sp.]|nr:depupylase/deamidase Dop [Trueperella sp.]